MAELEASGGFAFLFRTDQGRIDRVTWWRGTLPILLVGGLLTLGWFLVRPYTHDAIRQPPALAVLGYLYLVVFSFATILLFVCEYNLSAKRFTARGQPRALAGLLPGTVLLAGALSWYAPRSQGSVPGWAEGAMLAVVLVVVVWNAVELGVRGSG